VHDAPPPEEIPLFPLSNVVLFPGLRVPLHVFEPRYRAMTADALAAAKRIAMIAVRPEHALEMEGDPPLFAVGCIGRIVAHESLPGGRYNIVLLGEQRFRVLSELPRPAPRLYRVARVQRLADPWDPASAPRIAALRGGVSRLFSELVRALAPERARELSPDLLAEIDDATFVNTLCQLLDLPPSEKQGLLEAEGVAARYEGLAAVLHFRLAELDGRAGGGLTRH
jgi:Lon protease-like protein